jgi:hypothetical protein
LTLLRSHCSGNTAGQPPFQDRVSGLADWVFPWDKGRPWDNRWYPSPWSRQSGEGSAAMLPL